MPSISALHPQPPEAPLNPAAQQALAELLQAQASRKRLDGYFKDVVEKLTGVAGQLNDRGTEERLRLGRKQARLEANGEDIDGEEQNKYDAFQAKVADLTQKMDHGIRGVIDDQIWLGNVSEVLRSVATKTGALAEASQQQTQGPTPITTQKNRRGESDTDENENVAQHHKSQVVGPPDPAEAPTALLRSAFKQHSNEWHSKSLTERYTTTNEYTGFYRTVYDAKNPGENAPPVPHASLWFAGEEDPDSVPTAGSQSRTGGPTDEEEDSDIEIASERVSTKCPITLLPFKDPLTSMKCPHSFEKAAILNMLHLSTEYLPFTSDQQMELNQIHGRTAVLRKMKEIGTPMIKCPVCSCQLVEPDLKPDPVLLRKVRRLEAASRNNDAADETDEEGDEVPRGGTQRKPVGLGSSPPRRASGKAEMIKKEKSRWKSVIPGTQIPSGTPTTTTAGGATVVDLGEDDEEEYEDENEEEDDEMNES